MNSHDRKILENVFEISMCAAELLTEKKIEVEDSRDLCNAVLSLAEKFEQEHPDPADYLMEIYLFARPKLIERFNKSRCPKTDIYTNKKRKSPK